ncbi:MAG: hypothetical protein II595_02235 [Desulfovibrio sp.]|nr:hypothetical protein [Desulfovibrio sp.]
MRPEVEAWAVPECAYGERTYTVARPAFFQTSVLAAEVCAVVGEVNLAQTAKADMVSAGMRAGKAGEGEVLACQGFLRKEDQPWTGR